MNWLATDSGCHRSTAARIVSPVSLIPFISLLGIVLLSMVRPPSAAAQGGWTALAQMPAVQSNSAPQGGLLNGILYGWYGGNPNTSGSLAYGYAYDTLADTWTPLAPPPYNGSPSNDVIAIGSKLYHTGITYDCWMPNFDVWTFDGSAWAKPTTLPVSLCSRAAANVNGKLYLVGGVYPWTGYTRVDVYDPAANAWSTGTPFPHVIEDASAAAIDGKLYVVGGYSRAWNGVSDELWRYDPSTGSWTELASMPEGVQGSRAVALNGKLHVLGGHDGAGVPVAAHQVFDPSSGAWSLAAPMSDPRLTPVAGADAQFIYVTGGYRDYWNVSTLTERYSEPVDATPPVLTLPSDLAVEAGGPSGAAVAYSASATDDVDGPVAVTCVPTSGATFAIGTTTVTCSATDAGGNEATGTFVVTVLSPAQMMANLIAAASGYRFQQGAALLTTVLQKIASGKVTAACNSINAFVNQVQAQSGKQLTAVQAAALIASARRISAALGCR